MTTDIRRTTQSLLGRPVEAAVRTTSDMVDPAAGGTLPRGALDIVRAAARPAPEGPRSLAKPSQRRAVTRSLAA